MDPISAIGVAAGIVAFVDFAWNLVTGTLEPGKSASNSIADDTDVLNVISDLQAVSSALRVSDRKADNYEFSAHLPALYAISDDCHTVATDMLAALEQLQKSNTDRVWRKLKVQWMRMRKEEKLQGMAAKLRDYRLQIILRLNLILNLILRVEQLRAEAIMSRMETLTRFDSLRDKLVTAVSNLESLLQSGSNITSRTSPPQDAVTSLEAVRELLFGLRSQDTEIQIQHQILRRLACPSVHYREEAIANASDGTFGWIFSHASSQNAQDTGGASDQRPMPHHFGLPLEQNGPGRPSLDAERDAEKLRKLQQWAHPKQIVMGRFYFWAASNDGGLTTLDGLYRFLLFEVLWQCPTSYQRSSEMFHLTAMVAAFDLLIELSASETRRFCFFVDGLDEFAGDFLAHRDLVQRLLSWVECSHVKLCTSSRPEPENLEMLSKPPSCLVSLHEMTRIDIQRFSQAMLESDRNFDYIRGECPELVHRIAERANGVFLWVYLIIRLLLESVAQQDSIEILYAKLEFVPLELNDLMFQRLLKPLNSIDELRRRRMLYFALTAAESPSVHAFAWLDEVDRPGFPYCLNIGSWSEDQVKAHEQKTSALLQYLTKGLLETVTVSNAYQLGFLPWDNRTPVSAKLSSSYTTVRLLHRSAYDFLIEPERLAGFREAFKILGPFELVELRIMVADLMVLQRAGKDTLFRNLTNLLLVKRQHDFPAEELDRLFSVASSLDSNGRASTLLRIASGAEEDFRQLVSLSHLAAFCRQSRYIERKARSLGLGRPQSADMSILLSAFFGGGSATSRVISLLLQSGASVTQKIRLSAETDSSFAPGASRYPPFEPRELVPVWIPIALRIAHFVLHEYFTTSLDRAADMMRAFKLILRAAPPGVADDCLLELHPRVGDLDPAKVAYCALRNFAKSPYHPFDDVSFAETSRSHEVAGHHRAE
ncbi:hypothetical protein B0T26DRAFT_676212 [Lasiosphaeria miniovina]|uniref:NACHT domain-containing protein n=1 Tax=Lasiosphaeria miniovina TaxID=1954250 RepID=A0AA40DYU7_9PEZI|nr:uncharacterized protein B0T26DRAFT_676212 [Lasiosphaeria miniovina]KAK0717981.1 hypothetical protein B0T26DRAFT_676212 [Lasiosphaeria miniovina]